MITNPQILTPSPEDEERRREQFLVWEEIKKLPTSDQDALFDMLKKAQSGDATALDAIIDSAYEERPVPIDEFILGRKYLNLRGQVPPEKMDLFARLDHPRLRHAYILAGSGSGKGFMVGTMMARTLYRLLCLRNPQFFYFLGPGSGIAVLSLSVSKEQAKDVTYAELKGRLENSPWFKGKYQAFKYHMVLPKKIAVFMQSKNPSVSFGYGTFFASLDECNFMIDNTNRSLAEELEEAVMKSMVSRFPQSYKFVAISTLRDDQDYLSSNVERVRKAGIRVV